MRIDLRPIANLMPVRNWLILAAVSAVLGAAVWIYAAGGSDEREASAARRQATEIRAGVHREAAAGERAAETRINTDRLKEWNDDAEKLPDAVPDARELERRCRQLRDAGRDLPACRRPAG